VQRLGQSIETSRGEDLVSTQFVIPQSGLATVQST
jgi:hypothetical protein